MIERNPEITFNEKFHDPVDMPLCDACVPIMKELGNDVRIAPWLPISMPGQCRCTHCETPPSFKKFGQYYKVTAEENLTEDPRKNLCVFVTLDDNEEDPLRIGSYVSCRRCKTGIKETESHHPYYMLTNIDDKHKPLCLTCSLQ